ncbi:MAG TPA: gfo/Idh/MocA family oxidoreductase, partial [Pirellulaceae bacterium]|nr:gfo/Idh/MocA family oxidoreductase [Pirellulaceae bacterium]
GALGKPLYAIGTCYKPRRSIGRLESPLAIPGHIEYDLWCGPAEKVPLHRPQFHYDWHWDFNTGNGDMGNQGIHQMDIARWFLGYSLISPRVISIGGRLGYEDAGNTPNTQTVLHDYPGAPIIFETRGLPSSKAFQGNPRDWDRNMDVYRGCRVGVLIQYERGYVTVPDYTSATAYDLDGQTIETWSGGGNHYENFVDAIRTNDPKRLHGPALEGHLSSALCHTGNISHQVGRIASLTDIRAAVADHPLYADSVERMIAHLEANDVDVASLPTLTLGEDLQFDTQREQIIGPSLASGMLQRRGRAGFEIPEIESTPKVSTGG